MPIIYQIHSATMESWFVAAIFALLVGLLSLSYLFKAKKSLPLPPGPMGLPLLGHLHMLGDRPHRSIHEIVKKYSPIVYIRLGQIPCVVISSPEFAELFLKTHDLNFASRPKIQAIDLMLYGQKNMVFAQYGPYWRSIRKLCTIELFSSSKIGLFRLMREREVGLFIESLKNEVGSSGSTSIVNISVKIEALIADMVYMLVLGTKENRFNFKEGLMEVVRLTGQFNIADFIPCLKTFDLQGLASRMKAVSKTLDGFLEKIIDKHIQDAKELQGKHRDFVDVILSWMGSNNKGDFQLDRENVKAIMMDMMAAAMDTSSIVIDWVIAELLRHPRIMKLLQQELENVVGLNRMVEEKDLVKLNYLKLVIKESMRLHSTGAFLVPHESIEDITINGYFIPKKSRVLINLWTLGRDPNIWSANVEDFYPERFVDSSADFQGRDFTFLPFGSGRRQCLGLQLGLVVVQLVIAQLVHCFNLELPQGMSPNDIDMTEKFGLLLPRASHVKAFATYRLHVS